MKFAVAALLGLATASPPQELQDLMELYGIDAELLNLDEEVKEKTEEEKAAEKAAADALAAACPDGEGETDETKKAYATCKADHEKAEAEKKAAAER